MVLFQPKRWDKKTKYLDCKTKVFGMVRFSKYRGLESRDYFQFSVVCDD